MKQFEQVDHTADWAIRVWGKDLPALFLQAAYGMNHLLVGDTEVGDTEVGDTEVARAVAPAVLPPVTRHLKLEAFDAETLLVDWLGELAYWAESEQLVFPHIELSQVTTTGLTAVCHGGRAPQLHKHIKAVTYHELAILPTATGLEVTIVFDV